MSTTYGHLRNYRELVDRVDLICRGIETEFRAHLTCHEGCDGCCRQISLFPVEAAALAEALGELPREQAERIRGLGLGRSAYPDGPCPLLENGRCLLYAARPVICRTHGLPILTSQQGSRSIDFCPLNFSGMTSLPGKAVIDLDRLNTTLAAINALFVAECGPPAKERISIAEVLAGEL